MRWWTSTCENLSYPNRLFIMYCPYIALLWNSNFRLLREIANSICFSHPAFVDVVSFSLCDRLVWISYEIVNIGERCLPVLCRRGKSGVLGSFTPVLPNMAELAIFAKTADFAAKKHRDQRRKNSEAAPYINHPIGVAHLAASIGGVTDLVVLQVRHFFTTARYF